MESIEIRPAVSRSEFEQACEIWGTVFPEPRSFFQNRLDYDKTYILDTTWLALVNGRIAAAIQIFPYQMNWGSIELKVGGIGSVAALPEFRRRGLAQQILRRQSVYMRTRGYDLSLLLTGINSFYELNGWHTIPDTELIIDARSLERPVSADSYQIRICEESDVEQLKRIYEENNRNSVAPLVRSKEYWLGQRSWNAVNPENFLIAETSDQIAAYLRYKISDNQLLVSDCGYKQGQEQAAFILLHSALAKEEHVSIVRAGLPQQHSLGVYLQSNGARYETNTGKMWKNLNLAGTLAKMAPELTQRFRQNSSGDLGLPVSLLFSVGKEEVLVRVQKESVEAMPVTEFVSYNFAYDFSDAQWLTLLLKGFGALKDQERLGADYLRALFPERPYVFWNIDNF